MYVLCLYVIILLLLGNGMNQFCSEVMHLVIADYFIELSGEQPKVDQSQPEVKKYYGMPE